MPKLEKKIRPIVMIMIVTGLFIACASQNVSVQEAKTLPHSSKPAPYIIQQGDQLDIKFFYNPELNESVTVRPDGIISLQLVDEIQAAGLTPFQLDENLTQEYSRELRKPTVTIIVRSFSTQHVYVGGEVNQQGLIDLPHGMTALQAIFEAGGFKETAQPKETIVIRKGPDNRPIPMRLDLASAIYGTGNGADFQLQTTDIVYVPKSPIAKANQFVNQYIERLLLFRGISFGFGHQVNSFK